MAHESAIDKDHILIINKKVHTHNDTIYALTNQLNAMNDKLDNIKSSQGDPQKQKTNITNQILCRKFDHKYDCGV